MTPNTSFVGLAAILVALGGSVGVAEKKPDALTIKLSATVSPAKSDVMVRARVEPNVRSRELTIEWVAEDLSGGLHAISLDGEDAAATHHYTLKRLSPGQYVVTATLRLNDGKEIRRASHLTVVGIGGPEGLGTIGSGGSAAGRLRPAGQR